MTVTEWEPLWGVELAPDDACHTTCARHNHTPDRDDPAIGWCGHCGACIGTPSPADRSSFQADLERLAIRQEGPFGREPEPYETFHRQVLAC